MIAVPVTMRPPRQIDVERRLVKREVGLAADTARLRSASKRTGARRDVVCDAEPGSGHGGDERLKVRAHDALVVASFAQRRDGQPPGGEGGDKAEGVGGVAEYEGGRHDGGEKGGGGRVRRVILASLCLCVAWAIPYTKKDE
ncbi:unnamed protein product [Cutaneotrichosporon oleaginosum]